MTPDTSRRAVIAACVVSGASITMTASSTYVLDPMAQGFSMSTTQTTLLRFIPTLATILVVFLAGVLGDRVGRRRVISWGAALFLAGAILTGVSPTAIFAIAGLSLMAAGASTMVVVALALLSASTSDPDARARAFGTLALVSPFVYLIVPVVSGAAVTYASWRVLAIMWILVGAAALLLTLRLLPRETGNREAGELITPLLAGIALVFVTQLLGTISEDGLLARSTLIRAVLAFGSLGVLWVVQRRIARPSLSFGPITRRRSTLLLVATVLIPLASLWYTSYLLFEYVFGLTPLEISLIMIPAQLTGMVGAKLASGIIIRIGLARFGLLAFLALALSEAAFLLVGADALVLSAVLMAGFSLVTSMVTVVMSNAVMDSAPKSESGAMSSYRSASARIGGALASLVMGTVVIATYQTSLDAQAASAGLDPTQTDEIAQQLIDSESSGQDVPPPPTGDPNTVSEVADIQVAAMIDALYTKAMFGIAVSLAAGLIFMVGMRSHRREDEEAARPSGA